MQAALGPGLSGVKALGLRRTRARACSGVPLAWQGFCVDHGGTVRCAFAGGIMTKPMRGESASEAMARHKAVMAQREKALDLMARQAAARKAESDQATSEKPATRQPARLVRVGSSVRTVPGGLPSLGKHR
ncbi:hypothetical protein AMK32_36450 [Streptomyces sp. CB01883]|nr:hypothetical protein AMK32_36450 [Streptomyces sp. CB01883]